MSFVMSSMVTPSVNIAPIETLQIIATVPVLLDLLLCHSRAWLPREESRSFPTSSSGNSAARARHARGNDRKIRPSGRAGHYLVQDSIIRCYRTRAKAQYLRSAFRELGLERDTNMASVNIVMPGGSR